MRREDNELICSVGPGTPMGEVFRRYWTPIAVARQVAEVDGAPVRARFAGEAYVLFRDTEGRLGLLDELCPHRGASLVLGRNEECGIRCLYHGWKYDVDGNLLDAPNYGNESFRAKLKAVSYPVRDAGGLIWGYFGPAELQPPLPDYGFMDVDEPYRAAERVDFKCNYLQLLEGGLDSSHVGILHADQARPGWHEQAFERNTDDMNPGALAVADNEPELSVETTKFGFHYGAIRKGDNGMQSIRIVPFIMPSARVIPAPVRLATLFEVPLDDENTSTYNVVHSTTQEISQARNRAISGIGETGLYAEESFEWLGSWDNRFGQDRATMATKWTGLRGIVQEDAAMALSMGPIYDRTREHLVPADSAIIHMRSILLNAARNMEAGNEPRPLPSVKKIVGIADTDLPPGKAWQTLVPDHVDELEDRR